MRFWTLLALLAFVIAIVLYYSFHNHSGFRNVVVACLALHVCPSMASEAQCIPEATETSTLDELTLTLTATDVGIVINDAAKGVRFNVHLQQLTYYIHCRLTAVSQTGC